ncbi:SMC-Scp complex subunit ScpB [Candidatus Bathyarchaeota archaeon]|nr:SMC-Scp complex subunit ScpB [Candidatus Bathyarchaeota archaeon]
MGDEGKNEGDDAEKLRLIEAALYVAGRPLDLKTLCSVTGEKSRKRILKLAERLLQEYRRREGSLEILKLSGDRFVMQLKAIYAPLVRRLSIKPLLSSGPLKTLSYVALNQPLTQAELVAARGLKSYGHVRQLEKMGLLASVPSGRTKVLKTTDIFADYFNLSRDPGTMKRQFRALLESQMAEGLKDLGEAREGRGVGDRKEGTNKAFKEHNTSEKGV